MISQPTNRVSRLSRDHQHVHAKGEQADEGKEARVHRLDRRHYRACVRASSDGRAMRRQTGVIMIAIGLAKVVITNAVEEDHQHRPGHEEQHRSGERDRSTRRS